MTIDPLKIPCAFCGFLPVIGNGLLGLISCTNCSAVVMEDEWITGGINALVGKLARQGIRIEDKSYRETPSWAWVTDEIWVKRGSFEEAVLDAWKTLKREEKL